VLQDIDTPEALAELSRRMERGLAELTVLVRGAGEMASGVAHRLARSGFRVCMTELQKPMAVRRLVCFSEAVYENFCVVDGLKGRRVFSLPQIEHCWKLGEVPVIVDAEASIRSQLFPDVIVDGVMAKRNTGTAVGDAPLVIGLGPGFKAGRDVHVVIETNRGHWLGKVIDQGSAEPNTGQPANIMGYQQERVLKSAKAGMFLTQRTIGSLVRKGQEVGKLDNDPVHAEINGILRGILRTSTYVYAGTKLGDIDPRSELSYCSTISDKARTISGGVVEAILRYYNL
jgi:xanthine dehydrogenase accessory factor